MKRRAELSKLIGTGNASDINVLGRERAGKDNPIRELVYVSWTCGTQARSSPTGRWGRGRTGASGAAGEENSVFVFTIEFDSIALPPTVLSKLSK